MVTPFQSTEAFKNWRKTAGHISLWLARTLERLRHPYEPARHYMRGRPSDQPLARKSSTGRGHGRPAH